MASKAIITLFKSSPMMCKSLLCCIIFTLYIFNFLANLTSDPELK